MLWAWAQRFSESRLQPRPWPEKTTSPGNRACKVTSPFFFLTKKVPSLSADMLLYIILYATFIYSFACIRGILVKFFTRNLWDPCLDLLLLLNSRYPRPQLFGCEIVGDLVYCSCGYLFRHFAMWVIINLERSPLHFDSSTYRFYPFGFLWFHCPTPDVRKVLLLLSTEKV